MTVQEFAMPRPRLACPMLMPVLMPVLAAALLGACSDGPPAPPPRTDPPPLNLVTPMAQEPASITSASPESLLLQGNPNPRSR